MPNPVLSTATLTVKGSFNKLSVLLTNTVGKVVWRKENIQSNTIRLPVKELAAGMYIVQVKNNDWTGIIHFFKSSDY